MAKVGFLILALHNSVSNSKGSNPPAGPLPLVRRRVQLGPLQAVFATCLNFNVQINSRSILRWLEAETLGRPKGLRTSCYTFLVLLPPGQKFICKLAFVRATRRQPARRAAWRGGVLALCKTRQVSSCVGVRDWSATTCLHSNRRAGEGCPNPVPYPRWVG